MPMVETVVGGDNRVWRYPEHLREQLLILVDQIDAGQLHRCKDIFDVLNAEDPPSVFVLADGCEESYNDDRPKLHELLAKQKHIIIVQTAGDYGYGHHGYNAIILLEDGSLIHADCGGCSCEGSGAYSYVDTTTEAIRLIPEIDREMYEPGKVL